MSQTKETILNQRFRYFVGIDWGTQTHCVVWLDGEGRAIEQYNVAHSGEGLCTLVERLKAANGLQASRGGCRR